MKIYHTETVEDFDELMAELEAEGCMWSSGRKPTEAPENWKTHTSETCVRVDKKVAVYDKKDLYTRNCPDVPIIEYKAKVDEKMKFTRQNVLNQMDGWMNEPDSTPEDLVRRITALEYVTIPLFVADWLDSKKKYRHSLRASIDVDWQLVPKEIKDWVSTGTNDEVFARAWLDGYTIEPEQLYYIPLPDLETSDGLQQVLSKRDTYFASRPNEKLKQRYTKEELEQVPEVYKSYAKPIEEE